MKTRTKTILSLLLAANTSIALAASSSLSDADFFPELPIVLSASRLPQPLRDAPGSMTVIDRETIKRTGARDLADVLRWVPGFQVAQGTGYTNAPAATYHGLWTRASTGLQVMVDGRSYYSPLWYGGLFLMPSRYRWKTSNALKFSAVPIQPRSAPMPWPASSISSPPNRL